MRSPAALPLRLRLTLAFAGSVAIVLAGLGVFLYARLGAELQHGIDLELRSRAGVITSALTEHSSVPINAGHSVIDPDEAFAQVLDRSGRIVDTSTAVHGAPMLSASQVAGINASRFISTRVAGVDDPARLLATPAHVGGQDFVVVVGTNLGDKNDAMHRLLLLLVLGLPGALVLASGVGWLVAGAALRPVERMRRDAAAASLAQTGPSIAVPPTGDELARLATTLNDLLIREREALEAEHRFLDEASHDLRTPLAVLKAELDLALARPRGRDELEAALQAAATETDSLVRLAEDLLVLARSRRGPVALHREPIRFADFCAECAAPFGEVVRVDADDFEAGADPVRLRQAVRNLLDNAVRHGAGKSVRLAATTDASGWVTISVSDAGPGFPSEWLGRLARRTGAHGLGLSIVAAVAEAHGGMALAGESADGGAEVIVRLPVIG